MAETQPMPTKPTIVWCDVPVVDLTRAVAFYGAVLDCAVEVQTFGDFSMGILPHGGPHGRRAIVVDSEGNRIALHEGSK